MQKTERQKQALLRVNRGKRLTSQQFIDKAKFIHGERYDYSLTEYVTAKQKLKIICSIHDIQEMLPHHHIKGYGCSKCGKEQINKSNGRQLTQQQFIDKVSGIQGLSFEKTIYTTKRSKVIVTCNIHDDYETTAEVLLKGCGCPKCKSSRGEQVIKDILNKLNIEYETQKTYPGLIFKRRLKFDFFIPLLNCCIEFDGEQHFRSIDYWGGDKSFKELQLKDHIKNEYCEINSIPLLRIKYDNKNILKTVSDFLLSLQE